MGQSANPPSAPSVLKLGVLVRKTAPLLWEVMGNRLGVLGIGLLLIVVSRAAGLALPLSMRYLMDTIIVAKQTQWLVPLLLGIFAAHMVQGATSYLLTYVFSKESLKLVFELRCKVQEHISRLPLTFHDANKSGALALSSTLGS